MSRFFHRVDIFWIGLLLTLSGIGNPIQVVSAQQLSAHSINTAAGCVNNTNARTSYTITLWRPYAGAEETALNQVVTNAQSAFPGLTINAVQKPWDTLYSDYETAVSVVSGPDLFLAPSDNLGREARLGLIKDLTADLASQLSHVNLLAVGAMTYDGKIYGIPESSKAVALYYNKSKISSPAMTTAQLLSQMQAGKKLVQHQNAYHLYGWWGAFVGQIMNSSGYCIANRGGVAAAMQYQLDLKAAGATFKTDENQANADFTSGSVDMIINGAWILNDYRAVLGSNLGVVLMTNQASSQVFTNMAGHVPVRDDVTVSDALTLTFKQAAEQGIQRPQTVFLDNYWGPFGQMIDSVVNGGRSPNVEVANACWEMNRANGFPFVFLPLVRR